MEDFESQEAKDEIPSCVTFMKYWRECASFSRQFHHYYIYGKYISCENEKEIVKACFKYRITKNEELKEKLLQATKEISDRENFVEKPSSTVWEFREDPAADWMKKES